MLIHSFLQLDIPVETSIENREGMWKRQKERKEGREEEKEERYVGKDFALKEVVIVV